MPGRRPIFLPRWQPALFLARAFASPGRNLVSGVLFVAAVMAVGVAAYMVEGWTFAESVYMVVLTVYTVGYNEVHPIDTMALKIITITLIMFGCTGMIFVTGALVQFFTATQFADLLDHRRLSMRIEDLHDHVIICGYGRIGSMLARELATAGRPLLVLELNEARYTQALADGHLALMADATEEAALVRARIQKARAITTVLASDASNVFITLSARALNPVLTIIARGEAPSTERKLIQAGADRVVLPAHIGAERMAEMLLFPDVEDPEVASATLRRLGLSYEVVIADADSNWAGLTVGEIEARTADAVVIVGIERAHTAQRERATRHATIQPGDGVIVIGRSAASATTGFKPRIGG